LDGEAEVAYVLVCYAFDEAFASKVAQRIDGKDDIDIAVGIGVIVMVMSDHEIGRANIALDDAKSHIAEILRDIERLLAFEVNASGSYYSDIRARKLALKRSEWNAFS
jgi:hypothetical protein